MSNGYHFTYDQVKPCCWIKNTSAPILDADAVQEQFDRLQKIKDWIPECVYCYKLEKAGTESPRTRAFTQDIFSDTDAVGDIVKVEIQIDEECNAACLVCSPWNSTTWGQYVDKTVNAKVLDEEKVKIYFKNTKVEDRLASVINIVNFDKIKLLHFFGGEPFINDTHLKILQQVPHPENTRLVYTSNASVFPSDETIEIWQKFKNVHVGLSLDGIEEHFNYLRWPLQWNQVTAVLEKYRALCSDKFTINCSFTATPLNIFYIDRYNAWSANFFKDISKDYADGETWFSNPHPTSPNGAVNLYCIPAELQDAVKSKYGADSRIAKIIEPFNADKYEAFIKYIEFHDQHRKLNWRKTFSEVEHYFPKL